jgi:hypothetical protein
MAAVVAPRYPEDIGEQAVTGKKTRPAIGDFDIARIKAALKEAAQCGIRALLQEICFNVGRQVGEVLCDHLEPGESAVQSLKINFALNVQNRFENIEQGASDKVDKLDRNGYRRLSRIITGDGPNIILIRSRTYDAVSDTSKAIRAQYPPEECAPISKGRICLDPNANRSNRADRPLG